MKRFAKYSASVRCQYRLGLD